MAVLSSKQILQENNTRDHNSVRSLTLTHKALSDVSCLGEFKNLERLDLGLNSLTSLEGLKPCMNLKWLSVVQNKLQSLKGIEGLTKLTVLNAGKNKIKSMDEVKSLVSLRALILNDNEITSFCKLDQMKQLNTIVLSRNPIHEIGEALSKIKSITKLSLSHCQLQMIGSSLTSCIELKELRLAHNDIKTLPVGLSHNVRLQNLDIGNNLLANWSDLKVLSSLVNLKNLNLQGNPIAEKETLAKKVRKLLPNLQIFNAKPIDIILTKEGDRVRGSLNDGNKFADKKEKQIDPAKQNKKLNKYLIASADNDDDPFDDALDLDTQKGLKLKKRRRNDLPKEQTSDLKENDNGEKQAKRKSKSKRGVDNVTANSEAILVNPEMENELKNTKQKKDKSSDHEGNSRITGKSSKKSSRRLKQNKASVIDDGEAPFVELLATDASETATDSVQQTDHPTVPDSDTGFVTVTMKKKKKSQGGRPAFFELSPVSEVGLGGPSTWDD